ncbi:MAG: nucleotide sugar dehydrogenase, partial [Candidatus Omnitrophica bacterium]|nr:nucleotide sugar dehydrogenase [Candidatus Omnitrophota bacterium]
MSLHKDIANKKEKVAVVGLGYVGLPLALEFGKIVNTIGFDLNEKRIKELKANNDRNNESSTQDLKTARYLEYTSDPKKLKEAKFIIVAVPTPINKNRQPDLFCVSSASEIVGKNLSKGSIVVLEST